VTNLLSLIFSRVRRLRSRTVRALKHSDTADFEEAARHAFRTGTRIDVPRATGSDGSPDPMASLIRERVSQPLASTRETRVVTPSSRVRPGAAADSGLLEGAAGAAIPPTSVAATSAAPSDPSTKGTTRKTSGRSQPVVSEPDTADGSADGPTPEMTITEEPAHELQRQPGDTAPDFMLRPPASQPAVDDFFDGLIRRVEDHR
jgi:hypothetical protein